MAGKKIIAICQSGGEFETSTDGILSYKGGDAHAMEMDDKMKFKDFKSEVAEMFSCNISNMVVKYFLPCNKRTLISISNDKDLKSMMKFHKDSDTAEIYVMNEEAAPPDVSNMPGSRSSRTTLSEAKDPIDAPPTIMNNVIGDINKPDILNDDATFEEPGFWKSKSIFWNPGFKQSIFGKPNFGKSISIFGNPDLEKADSSIESYETKTRSDSPMDLSEVDKELIKFVKELPAPQSEFAAKGTRSEQHANCPAQYCYAKNLGTCVAISEANYCLIAADKMSTGSSHSRNSKITPLSKTMVMASSAPEVEVRALIDLLEKNLKEDKMEMTNYSAINKLWGILYPRVYFRTHNFNVFVGLDKDGKGSVYEINFAGFIHRVAFLSEGSGSILIRRLLHDRLKCKKPLSTSCAFDPAIVDVTTYVSDSEAIGLVKSCFETATAREIYMGDVLEIGVLNASGFRIELMDLGKKD